MAALRPLLSRLAGLLRPRRVTPAEATALYREARTADPAARAALNRAAARGFADVATLTPAQLFDAARLFLDLGDTARGLAAADRLLGLRPNHSGALNTRTLLLTRANRFTEALASARRLLEIDPAHAAARYHLRTLGALEGHDGAPRHGAEPPRPLLVGVGSGLGNLLHTAPLLHALAHWLGRPVDLAIAGEVAGSAFLLTRAGVVDHVSLLDRAILDRRYDRVFLTHSFGAIAPRFATDRQLRARDWRPFEPGGSVHEALHNLRSAEALLGMPIPPDWRALYYVGDLEYRPQPDGPIGLHAGSKGGMWTQKRWPHFAELAARLAARGLPCASFGTPDEYVPGTLDHTGGSIAEMARAMRGCRHFVANDSGVMNIANALVIPLTAIFGPTNPATRGPLSPLSGIVVPAGEYTPEESDPAAAARFRAGEARSIERVTVDQVEAAILAALSHHQNSAYRPAP